MAKGCEAFVVVAALLRLGRAADHAANIASCAVLLAAENGNRVGDERRDSVT